MHLFDVGAKALAKGENVTLQQLSEETKCEALLVSKEAFGSANGTAANINRAHHANSDRNENVQRG